jgi:hypothetical protein
MTTKRKPPLARDPVLDGYAKQIRTLAKRTVNDLVKIGELLAKAKKRAGHGNYLPWLERELGWSPDWAQNLIDLFAFSRTAKFRKVRHLPAAALYLLAKKSTPEAVLDAVIERAEAGQKLMVPAVREMIRIGAPYRASGPKAAGSPVQIASPKSLPREPITAEDLQAGHRRQLIDLLVDVARQLPSDRSIEEARAVVVTASAERKRDSFSAAVGLLYDFIGELHRALIEVPPAPTLRVIPGKDD